MNMNHANDRNMVKWFFTGANHIIPQYDRLVNCSLTLGCGIATISKVCSISSGFWEVVTQNSFKMCASMTLDSIVACLNPTGVRKEIEINIFSLRNYYIAKSSNKYYLYNFEGPLKRECSCMDASETHSQTQTVPE
jgi:hypothetical protein